MAAKMNFALSRQMPLQGDSPRGKGYAASLAASRLHRIARCGRMAAIRANAIPPCPTDNRLIAN
jgi:hypothetical protein